jgi:hypothetical protein
VPLPRLQSWEGQLAKAARDGRFCPGVHCPLVTRITLSISPSSYQLSISTCRVYVTITQGSHIPYVYHGAPNVNQLSASLLCLSFSLSEASLNLSYFFSQLQSSFLSHNMSEITDSTGNLTIINATPFIWHRSLEQSYQMVSWDFPETINPGP